MVKELRKNYNNTSIYKQFKSDLRKQIMKNIGLRMYKKVDYDFIQCVKNVILSDKKYINNIDIIKLNLEVELDTDNTFSGYDLTGIASIVATILIFKYPIENEKYMQSNEHLKNGVRDRIRKIFNTPPTNYQSEGIQNFQNDFTKKIIYLVIFIFIVNFIYKYIKRRSYYNRKAILEIIKKIEEKSL